MLVMDDGSSEQGRVIAVTVFVGDQQQQQGDSRKDGV